MQARVNELNEELKHLVAKIESAAKVADLDAITSDLSKIDEIYDEFYSKQQSLSKDKQTSPTKVVKPITVTLNDAVTITIENYYQGKNDNKRLDIIKLLLSKKTKQGLYFVDLENLYNGYHCLHHAAKYGLTEVCECLLIESGIRNQESPKPTHGHVNTLSSYHRSALYYAVNCDPLRVTKAKSVGEDPERVHRQAERIRCVRLLLNFKADLITDRNQTSSAADSDVVNKDFLYLARLLESPYFLLGLNYDFKEGTFLSQDVNFPFISKRECPISPYDAYDYTALEFADGLIAEIKKNTDYLKLNAYDRWIELFFIGHGVNRLDQPIIKEKLSKLICESFASELMPVIFPLVWNQFQNKPSEKAHADINPIAEINIIMEEIIPKAIPGINIDVANMLRGMVREKARMQLNPQAMQVQEAIEARNKVIQKLVNDAYVNRIKQLATTLKMKKPNAELDDLRNQFADCVSSYEKIDHDIVKFKEHVELFTAGLANIANIDKKRRKIETVTNAYIQIESAAKRAIADSLLLKNANEIDAFLKSVPDVKQTTTQKLADIGIFQGKFVNIYAVLNIKPKEVESVKDRQQSVKELKQRLHQIEKFHAEPANVEERAVHEEELAALSILEADEGDYNAYVSKYKKLTVEDNANFSEFKKETLQQQSSSFVVSSAPQSPFVGSSPMFAPQTPSFLPSPSASFSPSSPYLTSSSASPLQQRFTHSATMTSTSSQSPQSSTSCIPLLESAPMPKPVNTEDRILYINSRLEQEKNWPSEIPKIPNAYALLRVTPETPQEVITVHYLSTKAIFNNVKMPNIDDAYAILNDKELRTQHNEKLNYIDFFKCIVLSDIEGIKFFIQCGLDPTFLLHGTTALHIAAKYNPNVLQYLLINENTKIDQLDKNDNTALMLAVEKKLLNSVEYLLAKKANVNFPNQRGITPLHAAIKTGNVEMVKLLIAKGACIHGLGSDNRSLFFIAAQQGRDDVLEILLQRHSLTHPHDAAAINQQDNQGMSPVYIAAMLGHDGIIYLLNKEGGANLNLTDNVLGQTPLLAAAEKSQIKSMLTLIQLGANIFIRDKQGNSVFNILIKNRNLLAIIAVSDILLEINKTTLSPETLELIDDAFAHVCHEIATRQRDINYTYLIPFIRLRANIHYRDAQGRSIFHILIDNHDTEGLQTICEELMRIHHPYSLLSEEIDLLTFALVQAGYHFAKDHSYIDCISILIKYGANINYRDDYHNSVLTNLINNDDLLGIQTFCEKLKEIRSTYRYSRYMRGDYELIYDAHTYAAQTGKLQLQGYLAYFLNSMSSTQNIPTIFRTKRPFSEVSQPTNSCPVIGSPKKQSNTSQSF